MTHEVEYDAHGRMKYNPDFHDRHKKPWTTVDQKFLIENYDTMGPEECSFALGRTVHVVMQKAYTLRKSGLMKKPRKRVHHRRLYATRNEKYLGSDS